MAPETVVAQAVDRIATVPLEIETIVPRSGTPAAPAPGTTIALPTSPDTQLAVADESWVWFEEEDMAASVTVLPPAAAIVTAAPLTVVWHEVERTATVPLEMLTMMPTRSDPPAPDPTTLTALPMSPDTKLAVAELSWV